MVGSSVVATDSIAAMQRWFRGNVGEERVAGTITVGTCALGVVAWAISSSDLTTTVARVAGI